MLQGQEDPYMGDGRERGSEIKEGQDRVKLRLTDSIIPFIQVIHRINPGGRIEIYYIVQKITCGNKSSLAVRYARIF